MKTIMSSIHTFIKYIIKMIFLVRKMGLGDNEKQKSLWKTDREEELYIKMMIYRFPLKLYKFPAKKNKNTNFLQMH
jgi:hypothetical protein